MTEITSRRNQLVAQFRAAAEPGADSILLDGPHLLEELLAQLAPPRKDFQIFPLKYASSLWVKLNLQDYFTAVVQAQWELPIFAGRPSTSPPPKRPRSGAREAVRVQEIIARECLRGNSTIVDPTCRDELFQDAA